MLLTMWLYAFSKDEGHLCRFKESGGLLKTVLCRKRVLKHTEVES